jgi:hypothetical protein
MQNQMPQVTDAHRKMARLAGSWTGDDTLMPAPWLPSGAKAIGRMSARMALGGFHLIMDWTQERDGTVNFEGHGVLGWDPRGKCYTMHWFDSQGIEHGAPSFGTWEGDTLILTHETNHLGDSRQVYVVGDGEYRFRLENSADGKTWTTFMQSVYRRQ